MITALHAAHGSLWIGTTGRTVARVLDGHLTKLVAKGVVSQFAEDGTGNVWYVLTRSNGEAPPLCRTDHGVMKCAELTDLAMPNAYRSRWILMARCGSAEASAAGIQGTRPFVI